MPLFNPSLMPANNLSDLGSASTARTNLGLGTVATHALPAASLNVKPGNPTGTVVTSGLVMMGVGTVAGGGVQYTPTTSGIVEVFLSGWTNIATATNIITVGARYGTYAGPATTVASGSNGGAAINTIASWAQPSAGVLDVASTTGYASSGTVWVTTSGANQPAQISYTSITGGGTPSFNGCAFVAGTGANTIATGNAVTGAPQNGAIVVGTRFGSNADLPHSPPAAGTKDTYVGFPDVLALSANQAYWFDACLQTNNGSDTVTIVSISVNLKELLS
jgi:hypothetical protein